MRRAIPLSLTVEEAVAEMVNMDYIPPGFTMLEMIWAFQNEAEVDYENACIDRLPEDQLAPLKMRLDSCNARLTLAELLLESLQYEVKNPKNSMIVFADDSSSHQRLTLNSVSDWAADRYGIEISRWTKDSNKLDEKFKNVRWEDITIKIWKDHNIGFSFKKGEFKRSHFRKIGLMGEAKKIPNQLGLILIGLSQGKVFPIGNRIQPKDKTAISKLRKALSNWIGLSGEPFILYNQADGWKPSFTLINDTKSADRRAEEKAEEVPYDDKIRYTDD